MAAAVAVVLASLAIRRFDLTASEGEVAGKYAFDGGENEATCKGCKAVMQHIEREMARPNYDEGGHFGGRKTNQQGSRAEQAKRLNLVSRVEAVLDPTKCMEEMKNYDLAYIAGENTFQYKPPGSNANYPIHMELNEWAKEELGKFCESVFEEKEEELQAAVIAAEEAGAKSLTESFCKEELDLCHPPPPPPPPPPPGSGPKLSKKERMEQAEKVFGSMDSNSDGFVDKREIQTHMKTAQRSGKLGEGKKIKDEVAAFLALDSNDDDKVDLEEYKVLWVKSKKGKGKKSRKGGPASSVTEDVLSVWERLSALPKAALQYARESPYVAFSAVGVMSACMYVGGMAARLW